MADSKFLGHRSCICTVSNKRYYVFSVPLNFCLDLCGLKSNYNKGKSSEWGSRNIRNLAFYGGMLRNPIKLLSVTYYSIFQKKFLDGNLFAEGLLRDCCLQKREEIIPITHESGISRLGF